jgi:transcriptional regulator with XRE-family HTH domain
MENIIKNLRKEKGLTQTQLAETFNLDQTAISKWENDKAIPDTQTLIRLAEFFDVSTDFLLGRSNLYYPDRIKNAAPVLSDEERRLLELYRSLPRYLQENAYAELKGMSIAVSTTNKRNNKNA